LSIRQCKAIQGADCDSDHSIVRMKFILKLCRLRNPQTSTQFDNSNADQFKVELSNQFTILAKPEASDTTHLTVNNDSNHSGAQRQSGDQAMYSHAIDGSHPNNHWKKLRDTSLDTARATLANYRKTKRKQWRYKWTKERT